MKPIEFVVIGNAQPAGSKRAFPYQKAGVDEWGEPLGVGVRVTDDNPKAKSWQAIVAHAAYAAYGGPLLQGAVSLELTVFRPRPKSHYGKKGLKPSAPKYPTTRPDVLKLARAVEDALTGVIWRDDSQICDEPLHKRYGEPARVEIKVDEMT